MSTDVKTGPQAFCHYVDHYWNELPEVIAHLCRLSTGDPSLWWMDYFKRTYATPPRARALIVGCGNGWVERDLFDRGIATQFDCFDGSPEYLSKAEADRAGRPLNYFRADFDTYVPSARYDLIVNVASLHHVHQLRRMAWHLAGALSPEGVLVNWEYTGPDRNQYSDAHLAVLRGANQALLPHLRSPHDLRPKLATMLAGDPTEAVHASEIEATLADYFDVVELHPLGGGVAYPILWNNLGGFQANDPQAKAELDWLLRLDESLTNTGAVPSMFTFSVYRRSTRPESAAALLARTVIEPARRGPNGPERKGAF